MTNKEKVEKKIRELCPELQELSFGCEVIFNYEAIDVTETVRAVLHFAHEWKGMYGVAVPNEHNSYGYQIVGKEQITEIIGHPIHLEHVLLAINTQDSIECYPQMNNTLLIQTFGNPKRDAYYNLTKPFSEQDDLVFDFLADVLQVNEK